MAGPTKSRSPEVSLADVREAAKSLERHVHRTPVLTSEFLDKLSGYQLLFKCEALQKTGSFKARGLANGALEAQRRGAKMVVTHSSGNAGQALAWAAKAVGMEVKIVVPRDCPAVKKAAIENYGATVVLCEPTQTAREEEAQKVVVEQGAVLVHPSDNLAVIAGNGTVGLELEEQASKHFGLGNGQDSASPCLDAVIVPLGGGGLISGVATAIKGLLPNCKIIGAEPRNADDAFRSKAAGRILPHDGPVKTMADGLKTILGEHTFPIVASIVDDIILVDEDDIASATRAVWERMKIAIEPSAGVGVAVAVSQELKLKHPGLRRVGVILCGGNSDLSVLSSILANAEPLEARCGRTY